MFFHARHVESCLESQETERHDKLLLLLCAYAPTAIISLSYFIEKGVPEDVEVVESVSSVDSALTGRVAGICSSLSN